MKQRKITRNSKNFFLLWLAIYFSLSIALLIVFLLYFSPFKKPLIITPLGKNNTYQDRDVINLLYKANVPFTSVSTATDSSFLVNLTNGGQVILSLKKDMATQINTLQVILKRLTIEGEKINTLDFRFDKTVLKLN